MKKLEERPLNEFDCSVLRYQNTLLSNLSDFLKIENAKLKKENENFLLHVIFFNKEILSKLVAD